jgi:hypothetical protein
MTTTTAAVKILDWPFLAAVASGSVRRTEGGAIINSPDVSNGGNTHQHQRCDPSIRRLLDAHLIDDTPDGGAGDFVINDAGRAALVERARSRNVTVRQRA